MVENADDLATLITWENGKPTADAKGEVTYAANFLSGSARRHRASTATPSPRRSQATASSPSRSPSACAG
jgi:acyl-CoA reductase-like NAD-dependent aldehyde dehydrogenase